MFGVLVTAYVITVIGIPVYLHYCGGELENVNYVIKGTTCCGEDEDQESMADDCCKDENIVLHSQTDFTIKSLSAITLVKTFFQLFTVSLPEKNTIGNPTKLCAGIKKEFPPPQFLHGLVIATSVLRI